LPCRFPPHYLAARRHAKNALLYTRTDFTNKSMTLYRNCYTILPLNHLLIVHSSDRGPDRWQRMICLLKHASRRNDRSERDRQHLFGRSGADAHVGSWYIADDVLIGSKVGYVELLGCNLPRPVSGIGASRPLACVPAKVASPNGGGRSARALGTSLHAP
jgi:hypothetical protein